MLLLIAAVYHRRLQMMFSPPYRLRAHDRDDSYLSFLIPYLLISLFPLTEFLQFGPKLLRVVHIRSQIKKLDFPEFNGMTLTLQ
jgi:hypothetical protein